ncbi:ABC-type multidrug transport system ATPase subunit [Flavobacterium croceum DSM 17960]|uniref:ABC-type multidrug transport system ATPase subunit n=1 Tax=Flavobacterium croceum DSM 17960 TaxID=1121886 RepID=A0A2S4N607_9FLAO|nr:ABC transporter ATP-binding protein [Flavobacterium croceum]POS01151.1 ABC-type multidrug transport system ATPase subunit [Flavobacterium croceum DSM 17960]
MGILVENISKKYQNTTAIQDISFEVNKGELFGLIGPDGAGKTTIFRIVTTLLIPNSGKVTVAGLDVVQQYKQIRNIVGYMPGKFSLYQDLTVEENLQFFATIFGTTISENYHLIKDIYTQIEPYKARRAGALSGGMKQKLALCCALIHKPKVLFLDEPTTGVDPVSRKEFWEMLKRLKQFGITILVSTPYMDEASLCDRIALIQKGKILKIDTPQRLIQNFSKIIWNIKSSNKYLLLEDLKAFEHKHSVFAFGDSMHFIAKTDLVSKKEIENYLKTKNHSDIEVNKIEPTIEDIFMDLS